MSRTFPLFAVLFLGGLFVSLLGGFLLASWTVAGIIPAYAAPPSLAQAAPSIDDGWRGAGYERIGLWEEPRAEDLYAGSSRL